MSSAARRARSPALLACALAVALAVTPPAVRADPTASLRADLAPNRLGADASVTIGFRLAPGPDGELPALSRFALRLPRGMGFAASQLGLATCSPQALLRRGTGGCPHESLMGDGEAQVRVPFGAGAIEERARVSIFMAKPVEQRTTTLFYFDGRKPVIAPLVLESQVVTPPGSSDSVLSTPIAPIPTVPEGPEVSMVALRAIIGPPGLRYFKRVGKRRVPYKPEGLSIPERCPRGGFKFGASFAFRDGSRASARAAVPCPPPSGARRRAAEARP